MKASSWDSCGAGEGANDYAIGTPDDVEAARAIKREPDESAWDVEHLLNVKGLPWDRKQEEMLGKEEFPARDGCTSESTSRSGSTVKLGDVEVVLQSAQRIIDQSLTKANAENEWQSAMRDDAFWSRAS